MARNRKRAKERRARRPQGVATTARPQPNTAPHERDVAPHERDVVDAIDELPTDAPDPIEHASPDVELAAAQMALGRPDLAGEQDAEAVQEAESGFEAAEAELEDELEADTELESAPDQEEFESDGDRRSRSRGSLVVSGAPGAAHPERRRPGNRLINFLQGSWRELQRVQWPDRRQVMQATGVVIGFVIVAGVFLGLADLVATKLMNYILK